MGFFNLLQNLSSLSALDKIHHVSTVVENSSDPQMGGRFKARIAGVHDGVPDEHLPWMMAASDSTDQTSTGIGSLRVPPIGSEVFAIFQNGDPHFPQIHGGVNRVKTKTQPLQGQNTPAQGSASDTGGTTPITEPSSMQSPFHTMGGDYTKQYPNVPGNVDQSGNFHAVDTTRDFIEHLHVTGTGSLVDGLGSVLYQIAAKMPQQSQGGQSDPKQKNPQGATVNNYGPSNVNSHTDTNISSEGSITITAGKNKTITCKGDMTIHCDGTLTLSGKKNVIVNGKSTLNLVAPSIKTSTPATLGGSGSGGKAGKPVKVKAPTGNQRPQQTSGLPTGAAKGTGYG